MNLIGVVLCMLLFMWGWSVNVSGDAGEPSIIDCPIPLTEEREKLAQEYAWLHYHLYQTQIEPFAVVIHWTGADTWESTYHYFYNESREDGTLNVAAHFLVDKDGTIYRLTPETVMNRHIIGYNWCAIGIENVGGVDGVEDLTEAQVIANEQLIRYLSCKYPMIRYVFGHYQQDFAQESGLYIEHVEGYSSVKSDPGPAFMEVLHRRLKDTPLHFFPE